MCIPCAWLVRPEDLRITNAFFKLCALVPEEGLRSANGFSTKSLLFIV